MPVDSFILDDPPSPLEHVHVRPAFLFPLPGALKTEKCFPKEMSDITPFPKLFILSLALVTSLILFVLEVFLTFVTESNLF